MERIEIEPFKIIGISIRTTNENNKAAEDIPHLWAKFMTEGIFDKIPNKIGMDVYGIYTDYEKDHTSPYSTIIGCKVSTLEDIPQGMVGKEIEGKSYLKFTAKGNLKDNIVFEEWVKIWNTDLARKYTADFEVYGQKSQKQDDAEVDIFIAVA